MLNLNVCQAARHLHRATHKLPPWTGLALHHEIKIKYLSGKVSGTTSCKHFYLIFTLPSVFTLFLLFADTKRRLFTRQSFFYTLFGSAVDKTFAGKEDGGCFLLGATILSLILCVL